MSIFLNQQKINGSAIKVAATLPLSSADMSGQSSYAETAETGDKPKQLTVTMQIKYSNTKDLSALVVLAQAKNEVAERLVYSVVNTTARAMNIRRVRFDGDLMVREDESTKLWNVSFKLIEVKSVPEVKEARLPKPPVADQTATGTPVEPVITQAASPTVADLGTFEGVLKFIEQQVTP